MIVIATTIFSRESIGSKTAFFAFTRICPIARNPAPELFPREELKKIEALYLRDALNIAGDLFGGDETTDAAHDWAYNLIYKIYSIFDLAS